MVISKDLSIAMGYPWVPGSLFQWLNPCLPIEIADLPLGIYDKSVDLISDKAICDLGLKVAPLQGEVFLA